jgi:hypothetical protein
MIYRGPGFLEVLWFGSSPTPSIQEDWDKLMTGEGGRGWAKTKSQIISQESLPSINYLILSARNCPSTAKNQYRKFGTHVPRKGFARPTFMCLWAIYIFPWSICLFCCRKICGPILGIYKSSSILGSAPQGSFTHWAHKRWGNGERLQQMATDECIVIEWMYVCYKIISINKKSGILPPNLGKSLTDSCTSMWKLGLMPRNSQKRNK